MNSRTIEERLEDNLLLLYIIYKSDKKGRIEDLFKLQKITFLIENNLIRRKIKGLNYNFFRWERGPFSKDLSIDVNFLEDNNLIVLNDGYKVTDRGKEILKDAEEIFNKNIPILKFFDTIINRYAKKNVDEIKEIIYRMRVVIPRIKTSERISDILKGQLILFKMSKQKAKEVFQINNQWLETLDLLFDMNAMKAFERAESNFKEGKIFNVSSKFKL